MLSSCWTNLRSPSLYISSIYSLTSTRMSLFKHKIRLAGYSQAFSSYLWRWMPLFSLYRLQGALEFVLDNADNKRNYRNLKSIKTKKALKNLKKNKKLIRILKLLYHRTLESLLLILNYKDSLMWYWRI